jgi:predicted Fe-Mo cluster-binding NifX family protein
MDAIAICRDVWQQFCFIDGRTEDSRMRFALTVWKDRISPVCDVARNILVVDVEGGIVVGRRNENFVDQDPFQKIARLAELRVQTVICGAISRPLAEAASAYGIRMLPFVAGDVEQVIDAFLRGSLLNPTFCMPGCRGGGRRFHRMGILGSTGPPARRPVTTSFGRDIVMPRGDGTGPAGKGPQSGQRRGPCQNPGQTGPSGGRRGGGGGQGRDQDSGQGQGRGRGKGRGPGQGRDSS